MASSTTQARHRAHAGSTVVSSGGSGAVTSSWAPSRSCRSRCASPRAAPCPSACRRSGRPAGAPWPARGPGLAWPPPAQPGAPRPRRRPRRPRAAAARTDRGRRRRGGCCWWRCARELGGHPRTQPHGRYDADLLPGSGRPGGARRRSLLGGLCAWRSCSGGASSGACTGR